LEIYIRFHSISPALHSTFPDLNNSFSMWARQLLAGDASIKKCLF